MLAPVVPGISKAFGRVVRERREALGLSQEALAARAGIHRTYISSIELGKVSSNSLLKKSSHLQL